MGTQEPEGTDLSPSPDDVSTDSGFAAMLAERGLGPIDEPPREDEDRFVEQAGVPPQTQATEEAPPEEGGEAEPEQDPALAELLAQHDGDAQAALAAYVKENENRESLIGRQGQELGELRQQMAHLQGRVDQATMGGAEEPLPEVVTEEVTAGLQQMFDERGAEGAMNWIVEQRPDLIEPAIQVWAEEDPFQAGRFASRYDGFLQQEQEQAQQPQQPQGDPVLDQVRAREQFTMLTEGARQQLGIDDQSWPMVRDHVVEAFNDPQTSPLIKNAIISPDPQTQFQGMIEIVRNAHGRAMNQQQQSAEAQAANESASEAEQRKLAAQVATGSLRPAAPEGKSVQDMSSEERVALFKQSLLSAPSTSVADGLTFGPPA